MQSSKKINNKKIIKLLVNNKHYLYQYLYEHYLYQHILVNIKNNNILFHEHLCVKRVISPYIYIYFTKTYNFYKSINKQCTLKTYNCYIITHAFYIK